MGEYRDAAVALIESTPGDHVGPDDRVWILREIDTAEAQRRTVEARQEAAVADATAAVEREAAREAWASTRMLGICLLMAIVTLTLLIGWGVWRLGAIERVAAQMQHAQIVGSGPVTGVIIEGR